MNRHAKKKGFAKVLVLMFLGALAFAFAFYFIFTEYYEHFRVVYVVKSAEADRHVIDMAQVIMAYPKLLKNDSYVSVKGQAAPLTRLHRAVLDKEKLDVQMVNDDYFTKYKTLAKDSGLAKDVRYPDTAYAIVVEDLDSGGIWALSGKGPIITKNVEQKDLDKKTNEMEGLLSCIDGILSRRTALWKDFLLLVGDCEKDATTKIKVTQKSFPVAIVVPDVTLGEKVDAGQLTIRMTEW